jgi:hypothetical protein
MMDQISSVGTPTKKREHSMYEIGGYESTEFIRMLWQTETYPPLPGIKPQSSSPKPATSVTELFLFHYVDLKQK